MRLRIARALGEIGDPMRASRAAVGGPKLGAQRVPPSKIKAIAPGQDKKHVGQGPPELQERRRDRQRAGGRAIGRPEAKDAGRNGLPEVRDPRRRSARLIESRPAGEQDRARRGAVARPELPLVANQEDPLAADAHHRRRRRADAVEPRVEVRDQIRSQSLRAEGRGEEEGGEEESSHARHSTLIKAVEPEGFSLGARWRGAEEPTAAPEFVPPGTSYPSEGFQSLAAGRGPPLSLFVHDLQPPERRPGRLGARFRAFAVLSGGGEACSA